MIHNKLFYYCCGLNIAFYIDLILCLYWNIDTVFDLLKVYRWNIYELTHK